MIIALDSGPAGLLTNPNNSPDADACKQWLKSMVLSGYKIALPEVIDYEIRRELLRAKKFQGLARLDQLKSDSVFVPIDSQSMIRAAELWAEIRQQGKATAHHTALDIDVILAAQASIMQMDNSEFVIVATLNKKHLAEFVPAEHWKDIHPV